MKSNRVVQVLGLIFGVVILRLVFMTIPNFAPFIGFSLFGAAVFKKQWMAWLIAGLAFFISDLVINNFIYSFYETFKIGTENTVFSILAFGAIVLFGRAVLRNRITIVNSIFSALGGGVIFFLISNFGVWLFGFMYPKTMVGLISCLAAGVPFIHGSLIGSVFFTLSFIGGYKLITQSNPQWKLNV